MLTGPLSETGDAAEENAPTDPGYLQMPCTDICLSQCYMIQIFPVLLVVVPAGFKVLTEESRKTMHLCIGFINITSCNSFFVEFWLQTKLKIL